MIELKCNKKKTIILYFFLYYANIDQIFLKKKKAIAQM